MKEHIATIVGMGIDGLTGSAEACLAADYVVAVVLLEVRNAVTDVSNMDAAAVGSMMTRQAVAEVGKTKESWQHRGLGLRSGYGV